MVRAGDVTLFGESINIVKKLFYYALVKRLNYKKSHKCRSVYSCIVIKKL